MTDLYLRSTGSWKEGGMLIMWADPHSIKWHKLLWDMFLICVLLSCVRNLASPHIAISYSMGQCMCWDSPCQDKRLLRIFSLSSSVFHKSFWLSQDMFQIFSSVSRNGLFPTFVLRHVSLCQNIQSLILAVQRIFKKQMGTKLGVQSSRWKTSSESSERFWKVGIG